MVQLTSATTSPSERQAPNDERRSTSIIICSTSYLLHFLSNYHLLSTRPSLTELDYADALRPFFGAACLLFLILPRNDQVGRFNLIVAH